MTKELHTVTISGTAGWCAGRGVLVSLKLSEGSHLVGYNRQEVEGTLEDFALACKAVEVLRETLSGSEKGSATALLKCLGTPARGIAWEVERLAKRAAKRAAKAAAE